MWRSCVCGDCRHRFRSSSPRFRSWACSQLLTCRGRPRPSVHSPCSTLRRSTSPYSRPSAVSLTSGQSTPWRLWRRWSLRSSLSCSWLLCGCGSVRLCRPRALARSFLLCSFLRGPLRICHWRARRLFSSTARG
eukprot:Amastigsp_a676903_9.p3 type:complete len:134 gc:universal Amastigsp_a676903_9:1251-850(-)